MANNTISLQSNANFTVTPNGTIGLDNTNPQYTWDVSGSGNYSAGLFISGVSVLTSLSYVAGSTGFTNGLAWITFHNGTMPTGAFGSGLYAVQLDYNFSTGYFVPPTGYNLGASGKTATGFYALAAGHPTSTAIIDYVCYANNN